MNEVLPIPTYKSTLSTKYKPVNEVSEVRLDEALCKDTEYPLSDQERMKFRHLLWQNWTEFKLGSTSFVKHDINHHRRANETKC